MRFQMIFLAALLSQGCIIVGELPKDGLSDTGATLGDDSVSDVEFTATPNIIEPMERTVVELTSNPGLDFSLVHDVYALGDAEVLDFRIRDASIDIMMLALEEAESGTIHLVLDLGDEQMEVAQDIIEIKLAENPTPPLEDEDTGGQEQEPIQ